MYRTLNILVLSSRPPRHSGGLGQAVSNSLKSRGHEVDFLTRYNYQDKEENVLTVFEEEETKVKSSNHFLESFVGLKIIQKIKFILKDLGLGHIVIEAKKILFGPNSLKSLSNNGISIRYPYENKPEVPPEIIIQKIKKTYDAVITIFWQDMINSTTLKSLYDKLRCPILILSPDMAPMTGGCFYFDRCLNFTNGCGNCIGLGSKNIEDQSRVNYALKKSNYDAINCAFLGNTWMNQYAERSHLFKIIKRVEIIIDKDLFIPYDKQKIRAELRIDRSKKFILMLRSMNHPRKGNKDIFEALCGYINTLSAAERDKCLVVSVGDSYFESIATELDCEIRNVGLIGVDELVSYYQASNFFINASHDDAGPSMINQSIMCGTPVICYDNGAALDVIENGKNGYKVETGDIRALSNAIKKAHTLSDSDYSTMSKNSRMIALEHNSSVVFAESIESIISEMNCVCSEIS